MIFLLNPWSFTSWISWWKSFREESFIIPEVPSVSSAFSIRQGCRLESGREPCIFRMSSLALYSNTMVLEYSMAIRSMCSFFIASSCSNRILALILSCMQRTSTNMRARRAEIQKNIWFTIFCTLRLSVRIGVCRMVEYKCQLLMSRGT